MLGPYNCDAEGAEPIILRTFGELLRAGYRLDLLCDDCRRAVRLEAATLPLGRPYQGARFRCRCGR